MASKPNDNNYISNKAVISYFLPMIESANETLFSMVLANQLKSLSTLKPSSALGASFGAAQKPKLNENEMKWPTLKPVQRRSSANFVNHRRERYFGPQLA
jgi:hypothetical protein